MNDLFIGAILTLITTLVANFVLEVWKRRLPVLNYEVKSGIPIKVAEKKHRAYIVLIQNNSNKTIHDINVLINLKRAIISDSIVDASDGLKCLVNVDKSALEAKLEYLAKNDHISITLYAEDQYDFPEEPKVIIRSPNNFKLININDKPEKNTLLKWGFNPLIIGTIVVSIASFSTFFMPIEDKKDVIMISANVNGLYDLTLFYAPQTDVSYYNLCEQVYAKAKLSKSKEEVERYRNFLVYVIMYDSRKASESKSQLWYTVGKIDMYLENGNAVESFKHAVAWSASNVKKNAVLESDVYKFLIDNGLLKNNNI